MAANSGRFEVVRWLAEHGADVKHADNVCLYVMCTHMCASVCVNERSLFVSNKTMNQ